MRRPRPILVPAIALIMLTAASCGGVGDDVLPASGGSLVDPDLLGPPFFPCVPNVTQSCLCSGGLSGVQRCSADGDAWTLCDCSVGPRPDVVSSPGGDLGGGLGPDPSPSSPDGGGSIANPGLGDAGGNNQGGNNQGGNNQGGGDPGDDQRGPTATGRWHVGKLKGKPVFVDPDGRARVLKGISMTGFETGTRETQSGAGFWMYQTPNGQGDTKNGSKQVIENVVETVVSEWQAQVVRVPICGSAWEQNYKVQDWSRRVLWDYHEWIDIAVDKARSMGAVVIIDMHLWAIAAAEYENGMEDGCTGFHKIDGVDSCAPEDWFISDPMVWQCPIANADGNSLQSALKNRDNIARVWADIAGRYADDSGVWFEIINEPYERQGQPALFGIAPGENIKQHEYDWAGWASLFDQAIGAIRDAGADNIIIVSGLDWGYDFGPERGPLADPANLLPWHAAGVENIAYSFHPYQHGACCGQIGRDSDLSRSDPYQSAFCSYYPNGDTFGAPSGSELPAAVHGSTCDHHGYVETQDKKMPPCVWVPEADNLSGGTGLCAGDRSICNGLDEAACAQVDRSSPEAGGWSLYSLPISAYGPVIVTEFGTFDCSSPYIRELLSYFGEHGISYTVWALWNQNSGGPGNGACGYPSIVTPQQDKGTMFSPCLELERCKSILEPLGWAGSMLFDDMRGVGSP